MAGLKCSKCSRVFDPNGAGASAVECNSGKWIADGTQWEDDDCGHCHLCLYDECEVFLRHCHWVCNDCIAKRT